MGMSKMDLAHKKSNLKSKLAALEAKALEDPLKKNWKLHDEIAELKKKLSND